MAGLIHPSEPFDWLKYFYEHALYNAGSGRVDIRLVTA